MATESELRDELHASSGAPKRGIDTATVLTGARARRTPKLVAFSSLAVLAIAGITTFGITSLPGLLPMQSGAVNSAAEPPNSESGAGAVKGEDAGGGAGSDNGLEMLSRCAQPVNTRAPGASGLSLTVDFPHTAPADGEPIEGTVHLTNNGSTHLRGTTASVPFMTLSRDGIVSWHSNGAMDSRAILVDLAPGASLDYTATVLPVRCTPADETGERFRDGLPPLGPGTVALSAAIEFQPDAPGSGSTLIISPLVPAELR